MSKALYQYYASGEHKRQNYQSYKTYDFSDQVVPKYEKDKDQMFKMSQKNIERLSLKNQKNNLIEYIKSEEDRLLHLDVNSLRQLHKSRYGPDVTQRLHSPQLYYEYDTTFRTTRQQMYEDKLNNEVKESFCDENTDYIYLWNHSQPLRNTKNSKIIEQDKLKQQQNDEGMYFPHKKVLRGYGTINAYMKQQDKNNNKQQQDNQKEQKNNDEILEQEDETKSVSQGIDDKSIGDISDNKINKLKESQIPNSNSMVISKQEKQILQEFKVPKEVQIQKELDEYKQQKLEQIKQEKEKEKRGSKAKFLNIFQNILDDEIKNQNKLKENEKFTKKYDKIINQEQQQQNNPNQKGLTKQFTFQPNLNQNYNNDNGINSSPTFKQLQQQQQNNIQNSPDLSQLKGNPMYFQQKTEHLASPQELEEQRRFLERQRNRWQEIEGDIDERLKRKQQRLSEYSQSRSKSKEKLSPIISDMEEQNLWQNKQKRIQQYDQEYMETSFDRQQKKHMLEQQQTVSELDQILKKYS